MLLTWRVLGDGFQGLNVDDANVSDLWFGVDAESGPLIFN